MQEDPGMQMIWDIRKELYEEMQTMTKEEWFQLMHQRAELAQQRIDEIRTRKASDKQYVEPGKKS